MTGNPLADAPPTARIRGAALRAPVLAAAVAWAVLFAPTMLGLVRQWWSDPDAGHGLLLAPVAVWLAWKRGLAADARPAPWAGLVLLVLAVLLRYAGALAAEPFTQRSAMLLAALGVATSFLGARQLRHWWLPIALLALAIPLPAIVLNQLALPLQLQASRMGAALLELRGVPVRLAGNVILLPNHELFVTEACSGLRSLTALLSLGLLLGATTLRRPWLRVLLLALAVVVAIGVNAVRVFLTGFLVYFVSAEMGSGFMHWSEGWVLFVLSFGVIAGMAWLLSLLEPRDAGAAHA